MSRWRNLPTLVVIAAVLLATMAAFSAEPASGRSQRVTVRLGR